MLRAEAATFEQLASELLMKQEDATQYLNQKKAAGKDWERQVAAYRTARYTQGMEAARAFLDARFDIVDLHDHKLIMREVLQMRQKLEQDAINSDGRISTLIFLDLNIDHGSASLSGLKPTADLLHQSEDTYTVWIYPQLHQNLKISSSGG